MDIISLSASNIDKATQVLYKAFKEDPLIIWLFGSHDTYQKYASEIFKSWIKWSLHYGIAVATQNFESVMLCKKPGVHGFTLWQLWRSGLMTTPFVLRKDMRDRILAFDKITKKEYKQYFGSDHFWYCWFLGTDLPFQKCGFGKQLMRYFFNFAQGSQLPVCLETSNERNVAIYQKLGYKIFSTVRIPDSTIHVYCMVKS